MRVFQDIKLLVSRYVKLSARNPIFVIMGLMTPLLYVALFSPLLRSLNIAEEAAAGSVLNFFIPGLLPVIAFSSGIFTGFGIIDELRSGFIERIRVTSANRFSLLAGPVFHDMIATVFQSLLFVLVALPFGFRGNFLGLVFIFVLLALLTLITSSLGNAIGVILKSEDKYAPFAQGVNLPVLLLSGCFLPMSLAPAWINALAHLNPLFYVVNASRALSLGHFTDVTVLQAFMVILPLAGVTMYWATGVFKKATA